MTKPWQVPTTMPSGDLMPHMSARLRTHTIDALFEAAGGFERAQAWIEASDDNFGEFFVKVWAKGAAKSSNVEHNVGDSVEALLDKLDAADRARPIEGTCIEVETP